MYTLARLLPVRDLLTRQVVPMGISLVIAEVAYKFGSFSLECVAFLGTWFALDALLGAAISLFQRVTKQGVRDP